MLQELKTILATCDNCGYEQEYTSFKKEYPSYWGKATRKEYVGTRMEEEKDALCPDCTSAVQNGFKKYAKSTLYLF